MINQLVLFLLLLFSTKGFAQNTSYFADNINGNDNTGGKTRNSAWKSFSKIDAALFQPGDQIYLKRGQAFNGSLHLKGSGIKGNPIKLRAFGTGKDLILKCIDYFSKNLKGFEPRQSIFNFPFNASTPQPGRMATRTDKSFPNGWSANQ